MKTAGNGNQGSTIGRTLRSAWRRLRDAAGTAPRSPPARRRGSAHAAPCAMLGNGQLLLPGIAEPHRWRFEGSAHPPVSRRNLLLEVTAA